MSTSNAQTEKVYIYIYVYVYLLDDLHTYSDCTNWCPIGVHTHASGNDDLQIGYDGVPIGLGCPTEHWLESDLASSLTPMCFREDDSERFNDYEMIAPVTTCVHRWYAMADEAYGTLVSFSKSPKPSAQVQYSYSPDNKYMALWNASHNAILGRLSMSSRCGK